MKRPPGFKAHRHGYSNYRSTDKRLVRSSWIINPGSARIFIQSWVPEHAELHLLLSMITPLGWLERVPSYKDQQEKLKELDLRYNKFQAIDLLCRSQGKALMPFSNC